MVCAGQPPRRRDFPASSRLMSASAGRARKRPARDAGPRREPSRHRGGGWGFSFADIANQFPVRDQLIPCSAFARASFKSLIFLLIWRQKECAKARKPRFSLLLSLINRETEAGEGFAPLVTGAAHATATIASGAVEASGQGANPLAYAVETLFRTAPPNANATDQDVQAETTRILASGMRSGDIPAGDKTYLAQLVTAHTGLSQADAEKRVDEVIGQLEAAKAKARQAADAARKAAAYLSIFTAVSMLIGAFIMATAAALGGRHRDEDWRVRSAPLRSRI
jgi:hypothetical protein